jgi:hypothetical protein
MSHAGLSPVGVDGLCGGHGIISQRSVRLCFRGWIPSPKECLEFVFLVTSGLLTSMIRFFFVILSTASTEGFRPTDGNTTIVSARAQDKHARVADGICRLIWNMRCKRRAFST